MAINGRIAVRLAELNLDLTLPSGQCFRWKKLPLTESTHHWVGVVDGLVIDLTQDAQREQLEYTVLNGTNAASGDSDGPVIKKMRTKALESSSNRNVSQKAVENLLNSYFQLDTSLASLYQEWSKCDRDIFAKLSPKFTGIRVLDQNPTETLFSFICSSCNNIKRISQMVEKMCNMFGEFLYDHPQLGRLHAFPTVEKLAEPAVDPQLRKLGFGYRAKFIQQAAKHIVDSKINLNSLKLMPHEEARKQLTDLPGIGPKVADCICLFSLGKSESIPVDTHVFQIAQRYCPHLKSKKSVSDKIYREIVTLFQDKFGAHAGWAHSVLFVADLSDFKEKKHKKTESSKPK